MSNQRDGSAVSVCMAAYNGGQFISEQILSILNQLRQCDELIIVDDASTDNTADIVESFHDRRIRLFRNAANLGVVQSFERALLAATGEIILLSDQDDTWDPRKVETILAAFRAHPEVSLVVSDASLMDGQGFPLANSYYEQRGSFSDRFLANLYRCKYLGCTMAFRAKTLHRALPFPRSKLVLHDIWIGTINRVSGGKTLYLPDRLVSYRRHDATVTGTRVIPLMRQMAFRLSLLSATASFLLRQRFGER